MQKMKLLGLYHKDNATARVHTTITLQKKVVTSLVAKGSDLSEVCLARSLLENNQKINSASRKTAAMKTPSGTTFRMSNILTWCRHAYVARAKKYSRKGIFVQILSKDEKPRFESCVDINNQTLHTLTVELLLVRGLQI